VREAAACLHTRAGRGRTRTGSARTSESGEKRKRARRRVLSATSQRTTTLSCLQDSLAHAVLVALEAHERAKDVLIVVAVIVAQLYGLGSDPCACEGWGSGHTHPLGAPKARTSLPHPDGQGLQASRQVLARHRASRAAI